MGEFLKFGELIKDEGNFYDFIVRCFLVFFMELVVREIMKVVINFNNYCFILSGVRIFKEGWLKVYGKYVKFDEVIFLVFKEGEFVKVIQIKCEKKKMKFLVRYFLVVVIKKMEDFGIGIKVICVQIFEIFYQRGYIEGKKKIKVMLFGMRVVEVFEKMYWIQLVLSLFVFLRRRWRR